MADKQYLDAEGLQRLKDYIDAQIELIANSIMIPVQANLYHTNIYNFEKRCFKHSDLKEAAKKGFELGLKAKEE